MAAAAVVGLLLGMGATQSLRQVPYLLYVCERGMEGGLDGDG